MPGDAQGSSDAEDVQKVVRKESAWQHRRGPEKDEIVYSFNGGADVVVFQNQDTCISNIALYATGSGQALCCDILDEYFVLPHDR